MPKALVIHVIQVMYNVNNEITSKIKNLQNLVLNE